MTEKTIDLHGMVALPFPSFDENAMYLERVTIRDARKATRIIRQEYGFRPDDPEEVEVRPIHMRWIEEIHRDTQPELDGCEAPCWIECGAKDADAVPFWKEEP